jgi:glycosyltransferase involved in cell wall biosynthesis
MASGRPVVAYAVGGVTESVQDGVTGVFFQDPTPEAMAAAMARLAAQTWDPDAIRKRALEFDRPVFAEKLRQVLAAAWQEKTGGELWPPA